MRRRNLTIGGVALALCLGVARAERFEDVDVAPLPVEAIETDSGYMEQRFRVANAAAQPRSVVIELRARYGGDLASLRRGAIVGPGSAATIALFKPALETHGFEAEIRVDGRRAGTLSDRGLFRNHSRDYPYKDPHIAVLISRRFDPAVFETQFSAQFRRPSEEATEERPARIPATFVRAEQDVSAWSGHWLAYSRFDGIVAPESDIVGAPDEVRDALRRYVETGGSLWIVEDGAAPPSAAAAAETAEPRRERLGFGQRWRGPDPRKTPYTASATQALADDWKRVHQAGRERALPAAIPPALLPIENAGLPIGAILLLMSGFALVIGPVNWIVAHRRRRPISLLWATPLLSLAMTAALFAYGLGAEGVTPRTRARALTLLDQAERRAASLALLAWYAPLAPSDGLRFGFDTELSPFSTFRRGGGRGIDWTRDQHWTGGWLPARTPFAMRARKAEPRRERIAVARAGDRLKIVNGLGADLEALWLADRDGRLHSVRGVPAGGEAALNPPPPGAGRAAAPPGLFTAALSGNWLEAWAAWEKEPAAALAPGEYLAVLSDSPFVETGLAGRQIADRRAWVIGRLAPEDLP